MISRVWGLKASRRFEAKLRPRAIGMWIPRQRAAHQTRLASLCSAAPQARERGLIGPPRRGSQNNHGKDRRSLSALISVRTCQPFTFGIFRSKNTMSGHVRPPGRPSPRRYASASSPLETRYTVAGSLASAMAALNTGAIASSSSTWSIVATQRG